MTALVRNKIKYVFVIFNENNSFDHEYGTFPGVNGLYSDGQNPRSAADTPGFTQTYTDVNGNVGRRCSRSASGRSRTRPSSTRRPLAHRPRREARRQSANGVARDG